MKKTISKIFGVLWPITGAAMIILGIYSIFRGGAVVDTVSWLLGLGAIISGIVTLIVRFTRKSVFGSDGKWLSLDSVFLIVLGIILMNTGLLRALGKIMFIIIGIILVYNAVQSLIAAISGRHNKDGWFAPRIIFSVILLLVGIWVFTNAGRVFTDMSGIIAGIFFITHGVGTLNDWIGRVRYNKYFAYLDDEEL